MATVKADELLSPADVAREAGVTTAAVRWWEKTGQLKATKTVSGWRLFARTDVDRFLKAREKEKNR